MLWEVHLAETESSLWELRPIPDPSQQENGDQNPTPQATHFCQQPEWVWKRTLNSRWEDRAGWNLKKKPHFCCKCEPLKQCKPLKRNVRTDKHSISGSWGEGEACNREAELIRKDISFFLLSFLTSFIPSFIPPSFFSTNCSGWGRNWNIYRPWECYKWKRIQISKRKKKIIGIIS